VVIKNIGYQVTTYSGESRQSPPFEILAGVTAGLAQAPLKFSLTLRHLEKYDLTFDYKATDQGGGEEKPDPEFFENLMRHAVIGAEIIPHRNFYLGLGYNYQRRSELKVESKAAGVGFTWGFGFTTSLLSIEFGRAAYHLAGASNHVSLIFRPDLLYKKLTD